MGQELLIVTSDHKTRRVELEGDNLSVGRAHSNDLCYPEDASLSRRHMVFRHDEQGWWVEDLGSKNGTILNGTRLNAPRLVRPGDRLGVGQLEITMIDSVTDAPEKVVFVQDQSPEMPGSATVMTSLDGVFSDEATSPLLQGFATAEQGTPSEERGRVFDNPVVVTLFRAARELTGDRPLEELFPMILELSIESVTAERGVLMTLEGDRLVTKAVHGEGFRISTTVRDRVLNEKASVLVRDMAQDEAFREQLSISAQQIHTMMAVPLQTDERVIGLIYVDSRSWVREFSPDDLNLLTVLANVAAIRIEHERLALVEQENKQAALIQQRILPTVAPIVPGVDLAGHNAPCHTVGGDYYDFIPYEDGRVAVVLGDVAGKGMSAALMMMDLQARIQLLSENPSDLGQMMSRLDQSIGPKCPSNRFITLFFGLIDPASGQLTYCNAGHNPPLVVRATGQVDRLNPNGTVLGILPHLGYEQQVQRLEPGDLMAIYSDGITEAQGDNDAEFGEQRLADLLVNKRDEPSATVVKDVLKAVSEWTGAAPADDDVTLVVVRRTG